MNNQQIKYLEVMGATIKSKKWYGRFWPPERRKIKIMQALLDYHAPEIEKKLQEAWRNHLLYGTPMPTKPQPSKGNDDE